MKIIKIFGIVAGIHLFALILIFANPGCSSTAKSSTASTTEKTPSDPSATASQSPLLAPVSDSVAPTPIATDGGIALSPVDSGVRFSPTRPNTAASTALEAKPVADVTPASTYTVAKGDSLWTIAKKNHTTVAELKSANNIKDSSLRLGQKLVIPGKQVAQGVSKQPDTAAPAAKPTLAEAPATKATTAGSTTHTVKAGETLGVIARKYHVKQGDIATANNISDPKMIRIGQELVIPGAKPATTKPASSPAKTSSVAAQPAAAPDSGPASATPTPAPASATPTIIISDTPQVGPSAGPATALPANTSSTTDAPPIIPVQETPHN